MSLAAPSADPSPVPSELCVAILAPFGQDAALMARMLTQAGIEAVCFTEMDPFVQRLQRCAAGVLTTEALSPDRLSRLNAVLHAQPPWSDVPLIVLSATIDPAAYSLLTRMLGNVTIIQRPLEAASLLSVVQSALRAREKQYQVRDLLDTAQKRQREIEALNTRLRQLMQETHHRVKNNLQVISAMIEMQAQDYEAKHDHPLEEYVQLKAHVHTLAIVHDLLTKSVKEEEAAQRVSAKTVLDRLLPMLQQTAWHHAVHFTIGEAEITSKQCIALSLILNELVSNALKHGRKSAYVRFSAEGDNARLDVYDDGDGFPETFSPERSANMGLELVENLVRTDLKGHSYYRNRREGGGNVTVIFPLPSVED